jgi:anthraniloyl-CoA monooxygenase
MKILCIGGGPAGLYFGLLMKRRNPDDDMVVVERNRPLDTFGWGVVFSDQTLGNLARADEPSARTILQSFNHWDDIDVHFRGRTVTSTGHGFCGIGRRRLLNILQDRCAEVGVRLVFETDVTDDQALARQYGADLVIASDGLNSRVRERYQATYQPDVDTRLLPLRLAGHAQAVFERLPSPSSRPNTAGSRRMPTSTTATPRRSSSKHPKTSGSAPACRDMSQEQAIAFCEKLFARTWTGTR